MALSYWFLVFVWVWWLPLMLVGAQEQPREGCSDLAKSCGNLHNISDPFWIVDSETGKPCGAPSFEVFCANNTPSLLSIGQFGITILNITYEERSLRAIDREKMGLVHASNTCNIAPSWNTSVRPNPPLRISPVNLELILYNCTAAGAMAARRNRALEETGLRCGNEKEVFVRKGRLYDEMRDNATGYTVDGCGAIVVPVLQSSGDANTSGYEKLIKDGFLLTWDDPSLPLPVAGKFTHPSNLLSLKFLVKDLPAKRTVFCNDFPYSTKLSSSSF